jgi:phage terminase large subunit-like protein
VNQLDEIREAAEADLETFINLVAPYRVLGSVHRELLTWWNREDGIDHQLVLLPRDHCKSAMVAYRVAWELTKDPTLRVLYISATSNLAEKQLKFIKDIFTSDIHQRYWPDHVHLDEGKREKWTTSEISMDHPLRKEEGIRDPSIFTAGLTTSKAGLHCDIAVLDDVVVYENAYTEEGRSKVKSQYSLLASIESADAREWVVGTRYHPKDLYGDLIKMEEEIYNHRGDIIGETAIYEIFERAVESDGDGTGEFLWPRQARYDGKWFGFNAAILAKKRGKYLDRTQFFAQYYNRPEDPSGGIIQREKFQWYKRNHITRSNGSWFYKDKKLNVYAAIDFAFSLAKKADYTAIVVIGTDHLSNIYVLDIIRFKTDKISEYFENIRDAHVKWDFRKLRAEVTVAQSAIVKELKMNYIRPEGLALSIDEHRPNRHQGNKEERMSAILEPRYDNMMIWHYEGGNCQILEDELVLAHPPHDDVKDSLASVIEIAIAPRHKHMKSNRENVIIHTRFGGVV